MKFTCDLLTSPGKAGAELQNDAASPGHSHCQDPVEVAAGEHPLLFPLQQSQNLHLKPAKSCLILIRWIVAGKTVSLQSQQNLRHHPLWATRDRRCPPARGICFHPMLQKQDLWVVPLTGPRVRLISAWDPARVLLQLFVWMCRKLGPSRKWLINTS